MLQRVEIADVFFARGDETEVVDVNHRQGGVRPLVIYSVYSTSMCIYTYVYIPLYASHDNGYGIRERIVHKNYYNKKLL